MVSFEGKRGLVLGIANDRSIAWAIAQEIMERGGVCGVSHLPDKPERRKEKEPHARQQVHRPVPGKVAFLEPLDVQDDAQVEAFMKMAESKLGKNRLLAAFDCFCGSRRFIAADGGNWSIWIQTGHGCERVQFDLGNEFCATAVQSWASVLAMTYFGGEKCVPGYNVMGSAKPPWMRRCATWPSIWERSMFASMR